MEDKENLLLDSNDKELPEDVKLLQEQEIQNIKDALTSNFIVEKKSKKKRKNRKIFRNRK